MCLGTLVTRIKEVLRIAVMGVKLFHVMVPLEDMVEFIDANTVGGINPHFHLSITQFGGGEASKTKKTRNAV